MLVHDFVNHVWKFQQLVEHELLSQPSIEPVKCSVVSDPLAIRVKQENQLIEEMDK